MNIRPLADRIVVLRLPAEDKIGSIVVPDTAKEKPTRAKVVAVGPGRRLEDGRLIEFRADGEEYVMLREEDILGVYED